MPITTNTFEILAIANLILAAITVVTTVLYLSERRTKHKIEKELSVQNTERGRHSILHQAWKKARGILGKAEEEGLEIIADSKAFTSDLEAKYDMQFQQFTRKKIDQLLSKLEKDTEAILNQTQIKLSESLEAEVKATRQAVENYKQQQLAMVDANIVTVLERTLNLVLSKKISLREEVDLVYEALKKAKIEKFIA